MESEFIDQNIYLPTIDYIGSDFGVILIWINLLNFIIISLCENSEKNAIACYFNIL